MGGALGAAIVPGCGDQEAAFAAGRAFLGRDLRRFAATQERTVPHNDGFGFGDFAPDYLFPWCGRPDSGGEGASFLVDGLRLLDLMAADPEYLDVARFAWETDIDQSEPNFPLAACAPIARRLPDSGRVQVRHHPIQAPCPAPAGPRWSRVRMNEEPRSVRAGVGDLNLDLGGA